MPQMAKLYNLNICPVPINDLFRDQSPEQIAHYLTSQKFCAEITVADPWQIDKLLQLRSQKISISKVISPYDLDKENLGMVWLSQTDNWINDYNQIQDPSWPNVNCSDDWDRLPDNIKKECKDVFGFGPLANNTDIKQRSFSEKNWLNALFYGLSVCDDLFFLQSVQFESTESAPPLVFSPGRCGTHVLKSLLGVSNHLHHNDCLSEQEYSNIEKLTEAKRLHAIIRNTFIDQVCSDAIGYRYGVMNTVEENYKQNVDTASKWQSFEIHDHEIQTCLKKIIAFSDILLGLSFFYNKKIEFFVFENLKSWFDQVVYKKNPYNHRDMIDNYDAIQEKCLQIYQPLYDQIIYKLKQHFGETLHTKS